MFVVFFGFLGVYEQRHQKKQKQKKQTHGPELADADDGLCVFGCCLFFLFFLVFFSEKNSAPRNLKNSAPRNLKKLSPHDDPFCFFQGTPLLWVLTGKPKGNHTVLGVPQKKTHPHTNTGISTDEHRNLAS